MIAAVLLAALTVYSLDPIEEHWLFPLGGTFVIEDDWELTRCQRVLPDLPEASFRDECLVVVVSSKKWPRRIESIESKDEDLVVDIWQSRTPTSNTKDYHPPKFLVARAPRPPGKIRFTINGRELYSVPRGDELRRTVDAVWSDLVRVRAGKGLPSAVWEAMVRRRAVHYGWPAAEGEVLEQQVKNLQRTYHDDRMLCEPLLLKLAAIRASPAAPRVFDLIESMEAHDPAFDPAWKALVAIGGHEVVRGCETALKSQSPRSRHAAMLILLSIGEPSTRVLAHRHLQRFRG